MFVWSFLVDYVNLWLLPRTVHAWGWFFPIGRLRYIFAGRRIFQVSGQWYLQVPPGNSVTRPAKMTADELVFFVNGKKVSRSCLLVWSSCCLGRDMCHHSYLVPLIWSGLFLCLKRSCCSSGTSEQEKHRQDTQRAKKGGRGRTEGCPHYGSEHTDLEAGKEQSRWGGGASHQHPSISPCK